MIELSGGRTWELSTERVERKRRSHWASASSSPELLAKEDRMSWHLSGETRTVRRAFGEVRNCLK